MEEEEEEVVVEKVNAVVDWLELPDHLYFEIMGKLNCFFDYARFGVVCAKWRSLIFNINKEEEEDCRPNLPPQLPLLLVPTPLLPPSYNNEKDKDEEEKYKNKKMKKNRIRRENIATSTTRSCSFYRITDKKVMCPQIQLKMPYYRHFRGSGHGWLVTMDNDSSSDYGVQLINPFFFPDPMVIPLPPLTAFPIELEEDGTSPYCDYLFLLQKAVLSDDPISNPKDYMVTVIWGAYRGLAFFKPSNKAWIPIAYDSCLTGLPFEDVIHYMGKVYAVLHSGALVICDMEKCMAMKILDPPLGIEICFRKYLVESLGELLQVHREIKSIFPAYSTISFKVFKLSLDPMGVRKPYSEEVKDLGGHALFLGYNLSISIIASDFPGCKPNCIYYTDDHIEAHLLKPTFGPHDLGVFNLEDGSIEKHYPTHIHESIWPNPIWIEPRLPPKKQAS